MKLPLPILLSLLCLPCFAYGQKAPAGAGTVEIVNEMIYDISGSFYAPVLYVTGTQFDDCCTISNEGATGLQITLNGVDHAIDPTQYIYESSFNGLDGNDRLIFKADNFPSSWDFSARGGDGDDLLQNLTANNFHLYGQGGDDTLVATIADREPLGVIGLSYYSDLLPSNPFVSALYGGSGNDTFYGGSGGVLMYGSDGDDTFNAGGGDDEVYGGNGDDDVLAGAGNDRVFGGAGMDTINGGPGDDWLDSGRYNSFRSYDNQTVVTGDVAGVIIAGTGDDFIQTGPLVDTVYAGPGNNVVDSPVVADNVSGSPSNVQEVALVDAPAGSGLVRFTDSYIGGYNIYEIQIVGTPFKDFCVVDDDGVFLNGVHYDVSGEYVEFKGFEGNDTFIYRRDASGVYGHASGGSGDDFLSVEFSDVTMEGDDGDDTFQDLYGTGSTGGPGDDVFYLRQATKRTTVNAGDGDDTIYGGNFGNYINAGAGEDTIHGGDLADTIYGGSGADWISAKGGDDEIDAGIRFGHTVAVPDGDDTVLGGDGNDTIKTGFGNDYVNAGNGDDQVLAGPDDDEVRGGSGNDTISLGNGHDEGLGGPGDDVISGNAGDDFIDGGSGANTLAGGPGDDIIIE